ncbi:MAG TPA: wax ester/triacylglycerol synthase family O-acyltransferase [Solirubrobacteraceae bacterium]|nr:wax ester/triacylglycerol synthase family O-acyltransferase [Solirubrobacteraceae bacterium]
MGTQQMTNADAAWLHMDRPNNLMVVNSLMWFDERPDRERSEQIIRERLVERFPRFHQRVIEPHLGLGIPQWQDDPHFDICRHLHHIAVEAPGDRAALQALVSELISSPLDRSKPLWDLYEISGYGSGVAIVTRIHHCIADGIALTRVLLSLTDEQPDAGVAPDASDAGHRSSLAALTDSMSAGAGLAESALHEGLEFAGHPRSALTGLASRSIADARALRKLLLTRGDAPSALKSELGAAQLVTWSEPASLHEIKDIGHGTNTTVNDVLVAAITGACRRYLLQHHDLVDEIRAMVPFNLRPLDQPLPRELGNRFGLVYLNLPVGIRGPRARLNAVHTQMEEIKGSPEGALAYGLLGVMGLTPPQVERRMIDIFSDKVTMVLTNVPGPTQPIYFAGAPVAGVLGWVPAGGNIGVGVSIFSYNGGVTIGLRVDAGIVPDPETIIEYYEYELKVLAGLKRLPPAKPTGKVTAKTAAAPRAKATVTTKGTAKAKARDPAPAPA